MSGQDIVIRDARLPDDEPAFAGFIDALQRFEHDFEPDRRIDEAVGRDYLAILLARVEKNDGRIFVAEQDNRPIGWVVFVVEDAPIYVVEEERRCGFVCELYVEEEWRGVGLGRRLVEACAEETRARGLKVLRIGVVARNERARKAYAAMGFEPYMLELRQYL
jgi:GNAT superfamily N-acetyltransferase